MTLRVPCGLCGNYSTPLLWAKASGQATYTAEPTRGAASQEHFAGRPLPCGSGDEWIIALVKDTDESQVMLGGRRQTPRTEEQVGKGHERDFWEAGTVLFSDLGGGQTCCPCGHSSSCAFTTWHVHLYVHIRFKKKKRVLLISI